MSLLSRYVMSIPRKFIGTAPRRSYSKVRVRFAPSPTGHLHIGGLRTALFNYMFARAHDGKFILRIEDTDQTRLVPGAEAKMVEMLKWAGIEIDEGPQEGGSYGPYRQSERLELYHTHKDTLIRSGHGYRCFCSEKRLMLLKKSQQQRNETPRYDNKCRSLTDEEIQHNLDQSLPYVVRLKLEHTEDRWQDIVYGDIVQTIGASEGDPVMIKADGFPTYHFANVVDDRLMEITHVLRGVEWIASGSKHRLLYRAFGWTPPEFAHIPNIVNKDGKKLSKRQNDTHVQHYKDMDYPPEVLISWLCSGSSGFRLPPPELEGLSLEQLTQQFDLSKVKKHSAMVDFTRLQNMNQEYLTSQLEKNPAKLVKEIRQKVLTHVINKGIAVDEANISDDSIKGKLKFILGAQRIHHLNQLVESDWLFLWCSQNKVTAESYTNLGGEQTKKMLELILETYTSLSENQPVDDIGKTLRKNCKTTNYNYASVMKITRLALYGKPQGPSISELLGMLGRETASSRMKRALDLVDTEKSAFIDNMQNRD